MNEHNNSTDNLAMISDIIIKYAVISNLYFRTDFYHKQDNKIYKTNLEKVSVMSVERKLKGMVSFH